MRPDQRYLGWLLSATLVATPLYIIRCSSFAFCNFPIPFTLLEVLIILTFGYWLFLQLKNKSLKSKFYELRKTIPLVLQVLILTFLLSGLLGSLVSPEIKAGLGIYKAYFVEPLLLFIVIFDYLRITKNYRLIVWSLVGAGLWIAILAISNQLLSYNPGNPVEFAQRGRASALYTTSNAVGLFLGPILILLFGYLLTRKNKVKSILIEKNLTIISLIILIGGLISSGSRGAYLGILAALVFFFSYILYSKFKVNYKKIFNRVFILFLILLTLVISLIFFNIDFFAKKALENQNKLPSGVVSRVCLWEGAVGIIKERPLIGAGLSGFKKTHDQYRTCSQEQSIYPHNIFLNFWTEVGIFGLLSFVGLCGYLFFNLLPRGRVDYLSLALASIFVVILFHGFVDVPYFKNDLSSQFWAILALGLFKMTEG